MERVARRARAMILAAVAVTAALMPLLPSSGASHGEGCTTSCGNISIPCPFGVEPGCYHDGGFNLTCNKSYNPPRLFLGDGTVQVLDISIPNGTLRINNRKVGFDVGNHADANGTWHAGGWVGYATHGSGPYYVAGEGRNNLIAIGCSVQVAVLGEDGLLISSCAPFCPGLVRAIEVLGCFGIFCCQAPVLEGHESYILNIRQLNFGPHRDGRVSVYIADSGYSFDTTASASNCDQTVPAVLGWMINSSACDSEGSSPSCRSNHSFCQNYNPYYDFHRTVYGHNCLCSDGYQGNPYIFNGCYDINECNAPDIYPCYSDCNNTQGGYHCQCPPGFTGNASMQNGCKDIDECIHPEEHSCYGLCINMQGTFRCLCRDGTYGDPSKKGGCVTPKSSISGVTIGLVVSGGSILLLLALAAPFITRRINLLRVNKLKERCFKQNHGLLLQQLYHKIQILVNG